MAAWNGVLVSVNNLLYSPLPGNDVTKGRLKPLPQQSVHRGRGGDKTGLKRILIQVVLWGGLGLDWESSTGSI